MNKRYLIIILSMFLLICFSGSVSADWVTDASGDALVAGYDIDQAKVVVYPPDAGDVEEYMKVSLRMYPGSHLPGIVIIEFDVDDDTSTGGSKSMTGIFKSCAGGDKLKVEPGFDIMITLILRDQGDDALTAWCHQCYGAPTPCSERDAACTGCDLTNCYNLGLACGPGDDNCYLIGETCTCNEVDCYVLEEACEVTTPCDTGRVIGEWFATPSVLSSELPPTERGRIVLPLPKGTDSDSEDCYTFPWRMIVYSVYNSIPVEDRFDLEKAKDFSNLKYQVSTWYDTDFATSGNDFINTDVVPNCAEVTDVVPNSGKANAQEGADICQADIDGNGIVGIGDLVIMKEEYTRINCPACN